MFVQNRACLFDQGFQLRGGDSQLLGIGVHLHRKGWELRHVTVRLQHYRIHAEDCMDCETKEGFLDRIDREIQLSGNIDEAQKRRLLEIAERCPVHRTLKSEINNRTSIKT